MRAAVLVTGDEILRGAIQERNAGILARSLEPLGIDVQTVRMAGDGLEEIGRPLSELLGAGYDLVCVTGGLGPTHDDLTMEAVARETGRPLRVDPAALAMVDAQTMRIPGAPHVRRALNEKQASIPEGAQVLPPPGTAPGCMLEHDGVVVVVLPGPPWELSRMWDDALGRRPLADLVARGGAPRVRVLRLHAVPESRLVAAIEGFDPDAWARLRVGICARAGELEVTIRCAAADAADARALEDVVAAAFPDELFSRDGATVDEVVARALTAAGQTVAVAESCTGGLLGGRLTERPGSSAYVLGGLITYSDAAKSALLGVDPALIRAHGAVSAECAEAMAAGARRAVGSDWALSVTGVAGPGGGSAEKPVGLVFIGIAGPDGTVGHIVHRRGGDRATIRERSVTGALHLLREALGGDRPGV